MGWFLTGVWSMFLVASWIAFLTVGITGGVVLATILMVITSLIIGAEAQANSY